MGLETYSEDLLMNSCQISWFFGTVEMSTFH